MKYDAIEDFAREQAAEHMDDLDIVVCALRAAAHKTDNPTDSLLYAAYLIECLENVRRSRTPGN